MSIVPVFRNVKSHYYTIHLLLLYCLPNFNSEADNLVMLLEQFSIDYYNPLLLK